MSNNFKTFVLLISFIVLLVTHPESILAAINPDVNSDGNIDIVDIGIVIDNYGKTVLTNPASDINNDSKVDIIDIGLIIDSYGRHATPPPSSTGNYRMVILNSPKRTEVRDLSDNWIATFTEGGKTVILKGNARTFREPRNTTQTVSHSTYVRLLTTPFTGNVDINWLQTQLQNSSPDILQIAMEYIDGASKDADYGPLVGGSRQEGSDFNDYLGITYRYPDGTSDPPEPQQIGSMDCSGYMRMVWGYRSGLPLTLALNSPAIPRRAYQIEAAPVGINISKSSSQLTDFSKIQIGDIVFFDADSGDGTQIDHMGMYLGKDGSGHYRFISSRKTANGPTLGDTGGLSILDGTEHYARTFRSIKRF